MSKKNTAKNAMEKAQGHEAVVSAIQAAIRGDDSTAKILGMFETLISEHGNNPHAMIAARTVAISLHFKRDKDREAINALTEITGILDEMERSGQAYEGLYVRSGLLPTAADDQIVYYMDDTSPEEDREQSTAVGKERRERAEAQIQFSKGNNTGIEHITARPTEY